jgi:hypothetical protein
MAPDARLPCPEHVGQAGNRAVDVSVSGFPSLQQAGVEKLDEIGASRLFRYAMARGVGALAGLTPSLGFLGVIWEFRQSGHPGAALLPSQRVGFYATRSVSSSACASRAASRMAATQYS